MRQRLEERVGHEEDGQSGVVLAVGHFEILLQANDLCVADVGSVEETGQVEQAKPWDQFEVELP